MREQIGEYSWHHYHASEFNVAIEAGQKAIDMDASFTMARIYLGRAYALNRMYKEAIDAFGKSLAEGSTDVKGYLGLTFALAVERRKAERVLAELISGSDEQYVSPYHFGTISLALGDVSGALQWLEKTVEERGRYAAALKLDPAVEKIRSDPRFQTLLGTSLTTSWGLRFSSSTSVPVNFHLNVSV